MREKLLLPGNTLLIKIGLLFFCAIIFHTASASGPNYIGSYTSEPRDSVEIAIHFPVNQSRLLRNFSNNADVLDELDNVLNCFCLSYEMDSIVINGYASPEGTIINNMRLAEERAQSVKAYIMRKFPEISRRKIITKSQLVDWQAIANFAAKDRALPFRDEVVTLANKQKLADIKKFRQLKAIGDGAAFAYIIKNYAVPLRRASGVMFYGSPKATEKLIEKTIIIRDTVSLVCEDNWQVDTVLVNNCDKVKKPLFAIKTNLLFDLGTMLNLEIEVPIGKRWSVLGEYIFPWWLWESKQYCLQLLSVNLEGRYWFGNRTDRPVLTGWFAGAYIGGGYYDIEWGNEGYQGEFYIAGGLSGGYAHAIGKNFRMEYSLGIGYLNTQYRHYKPMFGIDDEWHLIRQRSGNFTWIGPTRAKVSLVWMLNYNSYKARK